MHEPVPGMIFQAKSTTVSTTAAPIFQTLVSANDFSASRQISAAVLRKTGCLLSWSDTFADADSSRLTQFCQTHF